MVADVEVVGVVQAGVQIEGAAHPELLANRITDNGGPGVVVRGEAARPRLVQNVIRRNGTAQAGPGLLIEAGAAPVVRYNLIAGNAAAGIHLRESLTEGVEQLQEDNFFRLEDEENAEGPVQVDR